jgi:hypothetical protein
MPENDTNRMEARSVIYRTYVVMDLYRVAQEKVAPTRFLQKRSHVIMVAPRAAGMSGEYHSLLAKLLFKCNVTFVAPLLIKKLLWAVTVRLG